VASRIRLVAFILICSLLSGSGLALAIPSAQGDVGALLLAARTDLETLANERLGDGIRPVIWTNSFDIRSESFALELRLDLETLAGTLVGPNSRPDGWFGAQAGSPWLVARDIRHDLELLADSQFGPGMRPALWVGGDPLMRCPRHEQALALWFQRTNLAYTLPAQQTGADYCTLLAQQNALFVELSVQQQTQPTGDVRADLNALSRRIFRENVFPIGWTDGKDPLSIRQDMELLKVASSQVGSPVPEDRWYGPVTFGAEWQIARANRHDLELLADAKLGVGVRPEGWTFFDPLIQCSEEIQAFVLLLKNETSADDSVPASDPNYCDQVVLQLSRFVESLVPVTVPAAGGGATAAGGAGETRPVATALGNLAGVAANPNAYLDHGARMRIGTIPRGTPFRALARSSAPDSRMMYVTGEGFTVWIAWPFTSVTESEYLSLPYADDLKYQLPQLLCFATFCTSLVRYGDPLGGVIGFDGSVSTGYRGLESPGRNLQELPYSHVRLLFNQHFPEHYEAELRIEICPVAGTYNNCEPVLRLIDNGQLVRPVRVENGYPVWRLRYNLHDPSRLESRHYFVRGLWVSMP